MSAAQGDVRRRNLDNDERGMTLIEILAVITLLVIVMATIARGVFTKSESAKAKLNVAKMEAVKRALSQFKLEYGKYPEQIEDLTRRPSYLQDSGKLYTKLAEEDELKDIWENPYIYRPENKGRSYSLSSLGADGAAGGEDANQDITMHGT